MELESIKKNYGQKLFEQCITHRRVELRKELT